MGPVKSDMYDKMDALGRMGGKDESAELGALADGGISSDVVSRVEALQENPEFLVALEGLLADFEGKGGKAPKEEAPAPQPPMAAPPAPEPEMLA